MIASPSDLPFPCSATAAEPSTQRAGGLSAAACAPPRLAHRAPGQLRGQPRSVEPLRNCCGNSAMAEEVSSLSGPRGMVGAQRLRAKIDAGEVTTCIGMTDPVPTLIVELAIRAGIDCACAPDPPRPTTHAGPDAQISPCCRLRSPPRQVHHHGAWTPQRLAGRADVCHCAAARLGADDPAQR